MAHVLNPHLRFWAQHYHVWNLEDKSKIPRPVFQLRRPDPKPVSQVQHPISQGQYPGRLCRWWSSQINVLRQLFLGLHSTSGLSSRCGDVTTSGRMAKLTFIISDHCRSSTSVRLLGCITYILDTTCFFLCVSFALLTFSTNITSESVQLIRNLIRDNTTTKKLQVKMWSSPHKKLWSDIAHTIYTALAQNWYATLAYPVNSSSYSG